MAHTYSLSEMDRRDRDGGVGPDLRLETITQADEGQLKHLIETVFPREQWARVFLTDSHHGFTHGHQVWEACLKLVEALTEAERATLMAEDAQISTEQSERGALAALKVAAIFHDCGRFNVQGQVVAEEQKEHHLLSAERATVFCRQHGLDRLSPWVAPAIISHDFQSRRLTPYLESPTTIIGKIVQSADQMGWFHPSSVHRTLEYNKALNVPFFDPTIDLARRLAWIPHAENLDAVTVLLHQLFGPMGWDRFGIESARAKVASYKAELEANILELSSKFHVADEVKSLIEIFRERVPA